MRGQDRRVPQSYDEIVRNTVPDPDSSQRPTARQEALAREGFRAMDAHERALYDRVVEALEDAFACTNECWGFEIEIDREAVTLRGQVHDPATLALVENTVRDVAGVVSVNNRLVVGR
jgi:osmotically-inducible protein OsmY